MASTIRFLDGQAWEAAVKIFRHYGEAVSTAVPDTYYVSEGTLQRLHEAKVAFEAVDPAQYNLLGVTEEMFAEIKTSREEVQAHKVVSVRDPQSLDDILGTTDDSK
jgi:hypothetical protein